MEKLLLIDGNNLAFRVAHTSRHLSHGGEPVGLIYGFMKSLMYLKKHYSDYYTIIAWDSTGSLRRIRESEDAVRSGITPGPYKGSKMYKEESLDIKPKAEKSQEQLDFYEDVFRQMPILKEGLKHTNIQQVTVHGFEADDILCSYVLKQKKEGGESVVITSDHDYYQLIGDGCTIYDAMQKIKWTELEFLREYDFPISSWVDYGALAGDDSDRIYSPDGWGKGTAKKYIQQYKTVDNILEAIQNKKETFETLNSRKEAGEKILKKEINEYKLKKVEENFLKFLPRIRLGQSLKKMDKLVVLPSIKPQTGNKDNLKSFFRSYGFISLEKDYWRLLDRDAIISK